MTQAVKTRVVLLFIVALTLPTIIKYMQRFVVRNAVVTAPRYEMHAPIDGMVEGVLAVSGTVPEGAPVLFVRNHRLAVAECAQAAAEVRAGQERVAQRKAQLDSVQARRTQVAALMETYVREAMLDVEQRLSMLQARLRAAEAARVESAKRRVRSLELVRSAAMPLEDVEKIEAEHTQNEAEVVALRAELEQHRQWLRMLKRGLFPPDLSDGGLQAQNQVQTLELEVLACARRLQDAVHELDVAQARRNAVDEDVRERLANAALSVPANAVIWDVAVRSGQEVAKGDRLLAYMDRSQLMVEVAIDDATLELVYPGQSARIRLYGRSGFVNGEVVQVRGSGAQWSPEVLAASVVQKSARDGRVLVRFTDETLFADTARMCGVGRTAYVEFEGIGLLEQYFGAFLR